MKGARLLSDKELTKEQRKELEDKALSLCPGMVIVGFSSEMNPTGLGYITTVFLE